MPRLAISVEVRREDFHLPDENDSGDDNQEETQHGGRPKQRQHPKQRWSKRNRTRDEKDSERIIIIMMKKKNRRKDTGVDGSDNTGSSNLHSNTDSSNGNGGKMKRGPGSFKKLRKFLRKKLTTNASNGAATGKGYDDAEQPATTPTTQSSDQMPSGALRLSPSSDSVSSDQAHSGEMDGILIGDGEDYFDQQHLDDSNPDLFHIVDYDNGLAGTSVGINGGRSGQMSLSSSSLAAAAGRRAPTTPPRTTTTTTTTTSPSGRAIVPSSSRTVASVDETIKASNRVPPTPPALPSPSADPNAKKSKKGWGKFKKRLMFAGAKPPEPISESADEGIGQNRSKPLSLDTTDRTSRDVDDDIRGRLDGIDVLMLVPARTVMMPGMTKVGGPSSGALHTGKNGMNGVLLGSSKLERLQRFLQTSSSFTSFSSLSAPHAVVQDMQETSAGRNPAELVLEGFLPGGEDRWVVRLESTAHSRRRRRRLSSDGSPLPSLGGDEEMVESEAPQSTSCPDHHTDVVCDDGLELQKLLESMWGPAPPSHVLDSESDDDGPDDEDGDANAETETEDLMQLAAACAVPIDIDEDTFIVDTANHLQSIHDIASMRLRVS